MNSGMTHHIAAFPIALESVNNYQVWDLNLNTLVGAGPIVEPEGDEGTAAAPSLRNARRQSNRARARSCPDEALRADLRPLKFSASEETPFHEDRFHLALLPALGELWSYHILAPALLFSIRYLRSRKNNRHPQEN